MIPTKRISPLPLFDALEYIDWEKKYSLTGFPYVRKDFQYALDFLFCYKDNKETFNAYRREIERFLSWSWFIAHSSVLKIKRAHFEEYLEFCQSPPLAWIGLKKAPRFIEEEGLRIPNRQWRSFVATISKTSYRKGESPDKSNYLLSQKALQAIFATISSFYNFLIQNEITEINPVIQIKQKSKFLRKYQTKPKIRRLSERQWQYVIETAEHMAEKNPEQHERTLFIMTALYAMYLRISELTASGRWTPTMNDFAKDNSGNWWFTTVGKGNKQRQIAVSNAMLAALKRYRSFLGLTPLPSVGDNTPLLPKHKIKGAITSSTYIRELVQNCFDLAIAKLQKANFNEDADNLMNATVHWLRHTGISEDVKIRPREHVRDDAGHSSSAITDKYIDVELQARHASARKKKVKPKINLR